MRNEVLEIGGRRWLVREAISESAARDAIAHARVTGSVGARDVLDEAGRVTVLADVVQINSDGSERAPYSEGF